MRSISRLAYNKGEPKPALSVDLATFLATVLKLSASIKEAGRLLPASLSAP